MTIELEGDIPRRERRRRIAAAPAVEPPMDPDDEPPPSVKPGRRTRMGRPPKPKGAPLEALADDLEELGREVERSSLRDDTKEKLLAILERLAILPREAQERLRSLKLRIQDNQLLDANAKDTLLIDIALVRFQTGTNQQKALQRLNDAFVLKIRTKAPKGPHESASAGGRTFPAGLPG